MKKYIITILVFLYLIFSSHVLFSQVDNVSSYTENTAANLKNTVFTPASLNFSYEKIQKNHHDNPIFQFPDEVNKKRLAALLSTEGVLYATSLYGLNEIWYKKYDKSAFHFFNDSREWMQMDKLAHFKAATTLTSFCYYSFRWAGLEKKKAAFIGGAISFSYMTTIEILDGFSEHWGFSAADMTANFLGTAVFVTQELLWEKRRIKFKMSYHPTQYAKYRPEALGSSFTERILKDYNGQTQWISVSSALMMPHSTKVPKWLCISLGYGAEGMLGGFSNPEFNEKGEILPTFKRYRQLYLSFDVDFSQVKTTKKWVRAILLVLNAIKMPCPTLEYNTKGQFKFHYLYF